MNSDIDVIFLSKLQQAMILLDEIDDMIKNNPDYQQRIDYEISDYLHLIQNTDLNTLDTNKILNELKSLRLKRASHYRFYEISKSYNANRGKLQYTSSRDNLREIIKSTLENLNHAYNYRVLDNKCLKDLSNNVKTVSNEKNKKTRHKITKNKLIEMIDMGMRTSEIANKIGCTQSTISHYKKKYGIETREYKKRMMQYE